MSDRFSLLALFKSKRSGETYYTRYDNEKEEVTCTCKGWIFNRKCKHIKYLEEGNTVPTRVTILKEIVPVEL